MSFYLLYTLETSRAEGVTPSDALAFVGSLRRRRDPDASVFGGNLVVRADAGHDDAAVEHACEYLGIPRYVKYTANDTSDAATGRLYARDEHGRWVTRREVEAWPDEDGPDAEYETYAPAASDDVAPNPEWSSTWEQHPAAILQREHDFDSLGYLTATPGDDAAGVVEKCPEPTTRESFHGDTAYHAIWEYYSADDVPPNPETRLTATYDAASGYRGVEVSGVTVDGQYVAVTLTAPPTLSPRKAACLLRWPARDAYDDRWDDSQHPPTSRTDGVVSADQSAAAAIQTVRDSDATTYPVDLTYHVCWALPGDIDLELARKRVDAAAERWDLGDAAVRCVDGVLGVEVAPRSVHSPWLVTHWLRDALHGDGHPENSVGFGERRVAVSTTRGSLADHVDAFRE